MKGGADITTTFTRAGPSTQLLMTVTGSFRDWPEARNSSPGFAAGEATKVSDCSRTARKVMLAEAVLWAQQGRGDPAGRKSTAAAKICVDLGSLHI